MSAPASRAPADHAAPPPAVVAMGVSGSGKTTLGRALEAAHGFRFIDADDVHPPENVAKMRAGIPLDDADRAPWLARLAELLGAARSPTVLACSALKAQYRDRLADCGRPVLFVHLAGSREVLAERMKSRKGHYMPPSLLDSQLETLQPPAPGPWSLTLDCRLPTDEMCAAILERLHALGSSALSNPR